MIKINFYKTENIISKVEIFGHANAGEVEKDLVCAAITGIASGGLNAIDQLENDTCDFTINEGLIIIKVVKNIHNLQVILNTLYYQLLTIYQQYQNYISFKEVS
ncbi:hypothetical protein P344_02420 [Spiroplasma mirum ATCC 29335]|uniref:Ribosomal processing cysteine protease Prp n=1 Tax=Spiroplasma mirum ATCC 29335 TaxID=838561 RepID=W0GKZ6_9MOLU|nr:MULTISPECIES: ribosomal-processing cysteine protease Prp [Spiroplasma]AHF60847.1 hypothetical protein SMM_0404 [Spiroplasma mirum ATCC 29335]AHI57831.1 hypothetical protein P344_02420 [Spiroplasma mirum ATCC 29335]AKM52961.1 hypothetical protein SATRI_v1c04600 [Spiroplasma atrichopogonis]